MSDQNKVAPAPKVKKTGHKWAQRAIAKANAERFENGNVLPFDTLRTPYAQRKKRGKTADGEGKP